MTSKAWPLETLRPGSATREERHLTWIGSDIRAALAGESDRDNEVSQVVLTNLSQGGFGIEGQLLAGARVMVDLPIIGWREAEVSWLADSRAGCRFVQPLAHDELRAALSASSNLAAFFPGFSEALTA